MIRPTKHSHPDRTVINLSLILLTRIRDQRVQSYDALFDLAKKRVSGGDVLFMPSLSFLYVMGLIEYRPKNDSVEYVGPNEAF